MYGHHDRNAERAADVIGAAARWLPGLREAPVRAARVGIRPVPPGGPVIGFHPALAGLYIAVSHGGIGWGPVWGQIAAREISGHPVAGLDRWRPDRFLAGAADITEGEISCA
jgi:glycine/D-amino acid oxidase-like deaminating enzyme